MATETQWKKLRSLPRRLRSFKRTFKLNNHKFMVTDFKDFYVYDAKSEKWTETLTNIMKINAGGLYPICYDQSSKSLFYQDGSNSMITKIDVSSGEITVCGRISFEVEAMTVCGGELHLFGTRRQAQSIHRVYRKSSLEMIKETLLQEPWNKWFWHSCYSAPTNSIIKLEWKEHPLWAATTFAELHEYRPYSQQWVTWQWSQTPVGPICNENIIGTVDAHYMFHFGGRRSFTLDRVDDITIYDLKQQEVRVSKVKCPEKGAYRAVLLDDSKRNELAVFGFINSAFKETTFESVQKLPLYLIQMIAKWHSNEKIYLLKSRDLCQPRSRFQDLALWKISVDDIIR